jgi:putative colanic acid biosynthesis acetyltransferase WcaB
MTNIPSTSSLLLWPSRNPIQIWRCLRQLLAADYQQNRLRIAETGGGNNRNLKGLTIVTCFRLAQAGTQLAQIPVVGILPRILVVLPYKIFFEFLLGIEIPPRLHVQGGLVIFHGQGIVIHDKARIGKNCMLRHGITIGTSRSKIRTDHNPCVPTIGDDCDIGAGAIIIGDISIGDGASVGAGTVVTKSVPPGSLIVGSSARLIQPS